MGLQPAMCELTETSEWYRLAKPSPPTRSQSAFAQAARVPWYLQCGLQAAFALSSVLLMSFWPSITAPHWHFCSPILLLLTAKARAQDFTSSQESIGVKRRRYGQPALASVDLAVLHKDHHTPKIRYNATCLLVSGQTTAIMSFALRSLHKFHDHLSRPFAAVDLVP